MSARKEINNIVSQIQEAPGWRVTLGRHWCAKGPERHQLYYFSTTPSDRRAVLNLVAALKRLGLNVHP